MGLLVFQPLPHRRAHWKEIRMDVEGQHRCGGEDSMERQVIKEGG